MELAWDNANNHTGGSNHGTQGLKWRSTTCWYQEGVSRVYVNFLCALYLSLSRYRLNRLFLQCQCNVDSTTGATVRSLEESVQAPLLVSVSQSSRRRRRRRRLRSFRRHFSSCRRSFTRHPPPCSVKLPVQPLRSGAAAEPGEDHTPDTRGSDPNTREGCKVPYRSW